MQKYKTNILLDVLQTAKPVFLYMGLFSLFINILLLLVPMYSLQVLDRVLSTGSRETLLWLSIIMISAFFAASVMQALRSFVLIKAGEWMDTSLGKLLLSMSITTAANTGARGTQNMRDLNSVKSFLTGNGLLTLFDAPWSIIYLIVLFVIHSSLGYITLIGSLALLGLAWINEVSMNKPITEASSRNVHNLNQVDIAMRNAEAIEAMGMTATIAERWSVANSKVSMLQNIASYRSSIVQAVTKFVRLNLQIAIIGWGAYLALNNEITSGSIIAASILTSKALSPFEAAITTWKSLVEARKSYARLRDSITSMDEGLPGISLPPPQGRLAVEQLAYFAPGRSKPVLRGINFDLQAGDIMGMIGPSAAGKSTLGKLIVGAWGPSAGSVRMDGGDVCQWKRDELGRYVGYLPQDIELFSGTIRDNIARMSTNASDADVVKAAQMAGAHELILRLPQSYDTDIGPSGSALHVHSLENQKCWCWMSLIPVLMLKVNKP
jgi:ATP-binding cassette subfamily B protein